MSSDAESVPYHAAKLRNDRKVQLKRILFS